MKKRNINEGGINKEIHMNTEMSLFENYAREYGKSTGAAKSGFSSV